MWMTNAESNHTKMKQFQIYMLYVVIETLPPLLVVILLEDLDHKTNLIVIIITLQWHHEKCRSISNKPFNLWMRKVVSSKHCLTIKTHSCCSLAVCMLLMDWLWIMGHVSYPNWKANTQAQHEIKLSHNHKRMGIP